MADVWKWGVELFHTFHGQIPHFPQKMGIKTGIIQIKSVFFMFFGPKNGFWSLEKKFGTTLVYILVTYIISVSTFIRFYRLSLTQ